MTEEAVMLRRVVLLGVMTVTLMLAAGARADVFQHCAVSSVQYARYTDGSHRLVFEACGVWWHTPVDADAAQQITSTVIAAWLGDKLVSVQCGENGIGQCENVVSPPIFGSPTGTVRADGVSVDESGVVPPPI